MKTHKFATSLNSILVLLFIFLFSNSAFPQVTKTSDSLKTTQPESLKVTPVVPADTLKTEAVNSDDEKDKKGKKNEIILYTGVNFAQLSSSSTYESEAELGYQFGAYYKQGRLLYWQAGARIASSKIGYKSADSSEFSGISISDIDFPITGGINFTSFMNRVLSVRLFVSAVPAITLKVSDNPYGITKDKINSFVLYGQG